MDPIISSITASQKYSSFNFNFNFNFNLNFNISPLVTSSITSLKRPIRRRRRRNIYTSSSSSSSKSNPPQNPNTTSLWHKYTSPIKRLPILRSIFHGFTKKPMLSDQGSDYMQNGGIGMALLSVTSTAKVRISPFVATLAANPTFVSGFFAWLMAQSLKLVLHFCFEKKLDLRIMCSSGGMPSSHSALCTALTTSVAICHGVADSLFPVCLGFTLIVMYDAIGVRRHAGMQAEVLNLIVEDLFQGHPISKRKLKELLGHTPSQVVAGALLGILVACFCCQGSFGAI